MSVEFSSDDLRQLRDAFALFDKDGDGGITRTELADVLSGFGQKLDDDALGCLFDDSDANNDGMLTFPEFVAVLSNLDDDRPEHRALHDAFEIILSIQGGGRRRK